MILSVEALKAVHDTISQLQRLSTAIKRASAREYNVQAARDRDAKYGFNTTDDETCMKSLVEHRYPNAADELKEALATALSFRITRFRDRKRRHEWRVKLQERKKVDQKPQPTVQEKPQPLANQIEQTKDDTDKQTPSQLSQGTSPSGVSSRPSMQGSAVPTFKSELLEPPKSMASSVVSVGSTFSTAGDMRIYWPALPKTRSKDAEGNPFYECPYCFDALEVEETRRKSKWRSVQARTLSPHSNRY